ncbi:MAG: polyphosphate kinase 1, partial [Sandaracinaceae bacterium]|nr:polyphosphate kinase 1 [Sandaracinaceae bacterium]
MAETHPEVDSAREAIEPPPPLSPTDAAIFFNRELSWLEFNQRVIDEARDPSVPLLERLKFSAIASSNLDEFFMVRVAGLLGQIHDDVQQVTPDGMSPRDQLAAIARRVRRMREDLNVAVTKELLPELRARGVALLAGTDLDRESRAEVRAYFREQVLPVLTPLAIDPGHPFPHLRNKSLNLCAMLSGTHRQDASPAFALVQVPGVLPRLVRVRAAAQGDVRAAYVLLDDLIALHIGELFPGFRCLGAWTFRLVRNFDLSIDEEEAEDLLESVKQEVRRRDRGSAVAMTIDAGSRREATEMLRASLHLSEEFVFSVDGPLAIPDLAAMGEILADVPELKDEPFTPQLPPPFRDADNLFEVIAQQDILLHHPYESFDPVVRLIEDAAVDPLVLAIKQTLYRTSGDSPIVKALMRAAENGKQVTALVEIKARFDEENNILWARKLEESGVHVVYGLLGLKTHAKACLIVRRESGKLNRYVHLGTGNYNPSTARLYTDLSYFTTRSDIAEDTSSLFNLLTSCTAPPTWRKLIVAPLGLHERVLGLIEREASHARAGKPARIIAKMNSLVDPDVILALYRASQAGVEIDLIIRGICCLKPGLPGVSERIRVRSVVDRFLEHARIFLFEAGGAQEVYAASADWMQRNFHRRVEVMFPIEDSALKARVVDEILRIQMEDDR